MVSAGTVSSYLSFPSCKVIKLDWSLNSQNHPGSFSKTPWGPTRSEWGTGCEKAREICSPGWNPGPAPSRLSSSPTLGPSLQVSSAPKAWAGWCASPGRFRETGQGGPAEQPHWKDSFQLEQAEGGRKPACRSLGAFRGPQSLQPPLPAQLRGSPLPRRPADVLRPEATPGLRLRFSSSAAAEPPWGRGERATTRGGRRTRAQHCIRCQGLQPRAWAVSSHGSAVSFPSPHTVQKSLELQCSDGLRQRQEPGTAVLVRARGQASQLPPAPPAPRGLGAPRLWTPV